ncbi:MAG: hypothetical protein COT17_03230 [Elusimicrobia bacterium CG08_land_8_20_14_0_20_51_18]|nr:MAG: hypothetical protein COT17_03230 [Elusimicrobia bacterium CG08_land_8_20_14_0_20_51_18]
MEIRKARLKDLPRVVKLAMDLLKYHHELDPYFDPAAPAAGLYEKHMKKAVYSRKMRLLVAEEEGRIIGYALGTIISRSPVFCLSRVAAINDVYVEKKFRERGIAALLVEDLYRWFRARKLYTVELSVFAGNKLALKVWEKLGFGDVMIRKRKNLKSS